MIKYSNQIKQQKRLIIRLKSNVSSNSQCCQKNILCKKWQKYVHALTLSIILTLFLINNLSCAYQFYMCADCNHVHSFEWTLPVTLWQIRIELEAKLLDEKLLRDTEKVHPTWYDSLKYISQWALAPFLAFGWRPMSSATRTTYILINTRFPLILSNHA